MCILQPGRSTSPIFIALGSFCLTPPLPPPIPLIPASFATVSAFVRPVPCRSSTLAFGTFWPPPPFPAWYCVCVRPSSAEASCLRLELFVHPPFSLVRRLRSFVPRAKAPRLRLEHFVRRPSFLGTVSAFVRPVPKLYACVWNFLSAPSSPSLVWCLRTKEDIQTQ